MERVPFVVGNDTVHVRSIVSGKPSVILVHGLGVSGDYYLKFTKELASHYDVYIIDLPGYGKTPKPKKPLTIVQLSDVLRQYILASGITGSVIMGQSMGCQVVAHTVVASPDLFKKVILLAPTVNNKERTVLAQGFRLFQDTFHESLATNLIVFVNYARMGVRRFLITSKFMVDDHIEDVVSKINLPILFVTGARDKIVPKAWIDHLAAITSTGHSAILANAPHLLQQEKPAALLTMTRDFIES